MVRTSTAARRATYGCLLSRSRSFIVTCPACAVPLVKGDGCSAVVCPCGKAFNYEQRKRDMKVARSAEFESMLGLEPSANAWDAWLQLALQARALAADAGSGTGDGELASLASTIGSIVFVVYVCMTAVNLFLATAESVRDYFKNYLTIPKLSKAVPVRLCA